jgi:hypothetical protein
MGGEKKIMEDEGYGTVTGIGLMIYDIFLV